MKKNTKSLKKKLKIYNPKLKEECGVFGISECNDASTHVALGLHALQHRGRKVVALFHMMEKIIIQKKDLV